MQTYQEDEKKYRKLIKRFFYRMKKIMILRVENNLSDE